MHDVNPWVQVAGAALGAAIGGMATFAGVLAAQWMTFRREHMLTERQAQEARERRWAEFQTKMLIELQEAIAGMMTDAFYLAMRLREVEENVGTTGSINRYGKRYGIKVVRVHMLLARIQDAQVQDLSREAIRASHAFRDFAFESLKTCAEYDEQAADVFQSRMQDSVTEADTRIGELLISLR